MVVTGNEERLKWREETDITEKDEKRKIISPRLWV